MVLPVMEIIVSIALLVAGIAVLLLIHICMVRGALREGGNILIQRMTGAGDVSLEDIGMLPCFEFGDGKGISGSLRQTDCAVCLECFEAGDVCRLLLGCGHSFHACCIDSWITRTPVCPVCRTRIAAIPRVGVELVSEASAASPGRDLV